MARRQPPPGCITATEAINRIGKSLYKYVNKGYLHPQGPATLKHKYYLESEVAHIEALEKAAFEEKLRKISAHFAQVRSSDMQSLYELAVKIFGSTTIGTEKRKSWIEKEPKGNYVIKRDDTNEVVAYFYVQSLSHERIMQYMRECRGSTITPEDIRKIESGQHEMIIAGIGRDPRADKQYTAALLRGFTRELEQWGHEGIEITHFYAYSETLDGVYLCFTMGMELWKRPRYLDGSPFFRFVLDVEKSDLPLLQPYKKALTQWKTTHETH